MPVTSTSRSRSVRFSIRMVLLLLAVGMSTLVQAVGGVPAGSAITIASYYFGNYHPNDSRNVKLKGKGWSEWELVKRAEPRFPGHQQPKVPLWGYTDESDPKVMARKIAAAADSGINAFIFDWYYYDDGPFLQDTVDKGFLGAPDNNRLKFALMWANHDWLDMHPYHKGAPLKLLYPGKVTVDTFEKITEHVIEAYFKHPSYWLIDGKPYFAIYDLTNLVASFGNVPETRAALDRFRARVVSAGFPGLHLELVAWGQPVLPFEKSPADVPKLVHDLGFDAVTSYVWIHHAKLPELQTDYNIVRDEYLAYWDKARQMFDVPYVPNVTMGWDGTPRAYEDLGGPNVVSGNTPERFREALLIAKQRLLAQSEGPRILTINCWNEWTEGSYLEPDTVHGMRYLDALRDVFWRRPASASAAKARKQ
jgi:Glycosyltransferase WbsX